ncbi:ATP-binding protein [Deinococcus humi]|uniref:histidine kinase n=1 Tax=Deinococcus humi TaxID=662880 RepID=A0A7W8JXK3_9DEIO|nr:PAS domain S-box-containing protein [Deinococcus humi]GGO31875.1 hypothetical protein GCM10008949_28590 [Deinococcus humi]
MTPDTQAPLLRSSFAALEGEHAGALPVAVLTADLRLAHVNAAFAALSGFSVDKLSGQPLKGWAPELQAACARAVREDSAQTSLAYTPDHGAPQKVSVWPLHGGPSQIIGVALRTQPLHDEAAVTLALSRPLIQTLTVDDVRQVLLKHALNAVGAYAGTLIEVIDESNLFMVGSAGYGVPVEQSWQQFPAHSGFPVVHAAHTGEAVFATLDDLGQNYPDFLPFIQPATRSFAALPLMVDGRVHLVLTLSFRHTLAGTAGCQRCLRTLVDLAVQALRRAQQYDAACQAQARATLLSDASSALASSLDVKETLDRITALSIHHVADWAAVYLPTAERSITAAAIAHQDPEMVELLRSFVTQSLTEANLPGTPAWSMQTGQAFMLPVVPPALIDQNPDPERRAALHRMGFHSLIHVPLTVQGRVVGVLGLASSHPERTYGPDDLLLAEQLAVRAALALDSALLHEASQLSEQRYRSLIDATRQTVWTNTADGLLLGEQPGWARLTGQDQAAYSRTGWLEAIHPDDRARNLEQWQSAVRARTTYDTHQRVRVADGTYRHFQVRAVPVLQADGMVREWVGVHTDITEQVELEVELERRVEERTVALARSNAELERFAYVASHDLQEPLRTIAGLTGLLERRYADVYDERGRTLLHMVVQGTERMKTLLDDLLVYSRLGAERLTLEPVDTSALVEEALERLSGTLEDSGGRVTYAALPTVLGSHFQLGQLFQNLIGNALKFRTPGLSPEVHIQAVRDEEFWHLTVTDNGIGIEDSYLERIFVMFQRLHTREAYAGTGLGLAICQKVTERHGGRIWVESQPGVGSTFHFTLPSVSISASAANPLSRR